MIPILLLAVAVAVVSDATTVLTLAPSADNPRNSEGSFVTLRDGRILFVYTKFIGGAGDHDAAQLAARWSDDEGRTWSAEDQVVVPHDPAGRNRMSVSLLRLPDGRIALFYLDKRSPEDCRPVMQFSSDEARSWSEPQHVIPDDEIGYYVVNNDRVVQLRSGRLVVPASMHAPKGRPYRSSGVMMCYLSDDAGRTWRRSRTTLAEPETMQEPGVVELKDGRLLMFIRTALGSQYLSESTDGGETWSPARPSDLVSPQSPASIERIPTTGDLLVIWNRNYEKGARGAGRRTPLNAAISRDEGRTWVNQQELETNPHGWYCYTAIHFVGDHVLLAYCAGDRRENNGLALTKIARLPIRSLFPTTASSE